MTGLDRRWLLAALLSASAPAAQAGQLSSLLDRVESQLGATGTSEPSNGQLPAAVTSAQGQDAIRQALTRGAIAAVLRVGRLDGYWGDGAIRIPLPGALGSIQKSLKGVGLSAPLDDLQLRVNRAAETAAPGARRLFTRAITSMTVEDVAGVLRGGDTAGTKYLKARTGDQLQTLFHPPMKQALDSSGAIRAFRSVAQEHGLNSLMGGDPGEDLTKFAVAKGLDGVFYYVGQEETAIRHDPVKQSTSLLKKVFGAL